MEENNTIDGTFELTSKGLIKRKSNRLIDILPGIANNPNSRKWKLRYKYYLEIEPEVREEVEAAERVEQAAWEEQQRARARLAGLKAEVRAMRAQPKSTTRRRRNAEEGANFPQTHPSTL